ncbi:MAG: hypothetical protein WC709_12160 [Thermoleophilia bacterium]
MTRGYLIALLFLFVALIVLIILWWYARNVKQDLDSSPSIVAGVRGLIELRSASVEELRRLSAEPILLKQGEEGVRVQIEHRPMLPLMAFVGGGTSAALVEAAGAVTERYGARWVVLVGVAEDGRVTVQRLA